MASKSSASSATKKPPTKTKDALPVIQPKKAIVNGTAKQVFIIDGQGESTRADEHDTLQPPPPRSAARTPAQASYSSWRRD